MEIKTRRTKPKPIIPLDGHRLGLVGGAIIATIVMALSFFVSGANAYTVAGRVGWSFVAGYGLTFILVYIVRHTKLADLAEDDTDDEQTAAEVLEEEPEENKPMSREDIENAVKYLDSKQTKGPTYAYHNGELIKLADFDKEMASLK